MGREPRNSTRLKKFKTPKTKKGCARILFFYIELQNHDDRHDHGFTRRFLIDVFSNSFH